MILQLGPVEIVTTQTKLTVVVFVVELRSARERGRLQSNHGSQIPKSYDADQSRDAPAH